jgi:citrate synthase
MQKKSVQLSGVVVAESSICSIDPDEGVLMYRGYDIADLAEHSTYEETALLLLDGEAPSPEALADFEGELSEREIPAETAEAIDRSALITAGLVPPRARKLKILGTGELKHPLTITANQFSAGAKEKIEAAGGQAIVVGAPTAPEE